MSLNVGSLIAYLDLDSDNFDRKTKSANKQIDSLALNMDALGKLRPELKLATEKAAAKAQALKDELARLKLAMASAEDPAEIRVEVAATLMKLAAVKAEIRAIHREAAVPITVEVDKSKLQQLSSDLDGISTKLKGLGGAGGLFGTALAFGPALAPFGGAALGLLGSIGAGALDAAGAVGVLVAALKTVSAGDAAYTTYQQAVAKANQTYQLAVQNGGSAKSLASAAKTRNSALSNAQFALNQSAYGKLSTAGQQFVQYDVNSVQPFKQQLSQTIQGGVLPGLTEGLHGLIADAPQVNGALASISSSVGNLLAEAGHALQSPFWKQWITWFGKESAANVGTMGHAVGQLLEALARMDQRSGGAISLVGEIDHLATRLNNWSASPGFVTFLDHVRNDEAQVSKFMHALWTDLEPILRGLSATGGAELGLLTGALDLISHLPTGWLEAAGRWLPIIFVSMKLAGGPLAGLTAGLSGASKAMAGFAEAGAIERMGMASNAIGTVGTALKGLAGAAGIGLLIDSTTRSTGALNALETAAGGAAVGFSVGGPLGAAIGGIGGLLLEGFRASGLFNHALSNTQVIDNARAAYDNLAGTLDNVTGAFTTLTRTQTLADIKKNGGLQAALNAGFSQRQAVDLALGTADQGTQARYQRMLASARKDLASANSRFGADQATALQQSLSTGANVANTHYGADQDAIRAAQQEVNLLIALGGAGTKAQQDFAASTAATRIWTSAQLTLIRSLQNTGAEASILDGKTTSLTSSVAHLAEKYKFTPKQISTVVQLFGVDKSLLSYQGVMATMRDDAAKGITVPINADTRAAVTAINNVLGAFLPITLPGATTSKPKVGHNASGTNSWSGGLTWVGEQGPELVSLSRGAAVYPHSQSVAMATKSDGYLRLHPADIRALGDHIRGGTQNQIDNTLVGLGY